MLRGPTDARKVLALNEKSLQMAVYFMTGFCQTSTYRFIAWYSALGIMSVPWATRLV